MKKQLLTLVACFGLAACSTGNVEWDSAAMGRAKMAFVGIPTVAGIGYQGSTTPLTREYSLTNKHVAYPTLRRVVRSDAFCDLALIRQDNRGEALPRAIGKPRVLQRVRMYGYSARTGAPVSGSGKILGFKYDGGCRVAITDAGSVQGMSGGPVFSEDGELLGVFYALQPFNNRSMFIPVEGSRVLEGVDL